MKFSRKTLGIPYALFLLLFGLTGIEAVQAGADLLTFLISIPFLIFFFRRHLSAPDEAL